MKALKIKRVKQVVGLGYLLFAVGCASPTVEDLNRNVKQHPHSAQIERSTRGDFLMPFPRNMLIGKWNSLQYLWKCNWYETKPTGTEDRAKFVSYEYDFMTNGTYVAKEINGRHVSPLSGNWEYDESSGDIILQGHVDHSNFSAFDLYGSFYTFRKQPMMKVLWLSENEFVLTPRNKEIGRRTELKALRKYVNRVLKGWSSYLVEWDIDSFGNIHSLCHFIKGYNAWASHELVWSPEICTRKIEVNTLAVHQEIDYNIVSCKREASSDFSYHFVLELVNKKNNLSHFRAIQQEFRTTIKDDYAQTFPSVSKDSLYVEFPEYELKDGRIVGRAVVLTISVTSLTYDPNTRRGKLAVKVNANQYEEARKWIRKNIETLARDKNIALTTGEIPPAAKFYLGREELKNGNILEIEFKTE